jgi:hypothetical protein
MVACLNSCHCLHASLSYPLVRVFRPLSRGMDGCKRD